MPTIDQAKVMARRLRSALATRGVELPHGTTLDLVAAELGYPDWNVAVVRLDPAPDDTIAFERAIPILRIFDEAKAREFYCDFLGFAVQFEHRFEPGLPLYMGIARAGLPLHLSEHHGDASPGSTVYVPMRGVRAYREELIAKQYGYGRPGVVDQPWGFELQVHDPFGNRLRFTEPKPG